MPKYKPLTKAEEARLAKLGASKPTRKSTMLKDAITAVAPAVKKAVSKAVEKASTTFALPKSLAGCADKLYEVREGRLEFDRKSTALKKDESVLRDYLIDKLSKGKDSGVQGQIAFAYVDTGEAFTAKDWEKIYAAIVKEYNAAKTPGDKVAAFRYLNRALSKEPMQELWDSDKTFPGVERIPVKKVNVSKRKGKK